PKGEILRKQLYENAITLAKNDEYLLPLGDVANRKIAYLQIGGSAGSTLAKTIQKYAQVDVFYLSRDIDLATQETWMRKLANYQTVIIGGFGQSYRKSVTFGVTSGMAALITSLGNGPMETILVWCGSPYALKFFGSEQATVVAYEDEPEAQQAAGEVVFGGLRVTGRLPVGASAMFREGAGFQIRKPIRFGFAHPEEVGMDSRTLAKVDSLAFHYVSEKAMPGCAILILRGNDIVYERGFGRTEYGNNGELIDPWYHTYDLASVTKVTVTTMASMRLVEQGRLELDAPISRYLPEWKSVDKGRLSARQLLQHNAGLPAWEPLFLDTYSDPVRKIIDRERFRFEISSEYPIPVGPGLYARADMEDWVWQKIAEVELNASNRVKYSDIGLMIMGHIIERITGETLESYAYSQFFSPLGMNRTWFKPGEKGMGQCCPPTEADTDWRHCVIRGYVHDPNAALLGGIAGHAGLFSNVYDLAKLFLMLKNQGEYGERRYFLPVTIEAFTKQQLSYSRKGLGWDKPESSGGPTSSMASASTYGHTGFTGTCAWVDPQSDLIFIFLSNRTYPTASNKLLLKDNVRVKIMDQAYLAIKAYNQSHARS
ncbi:MAG: serine hydrolase, partial [Bacteroidia bacterium]|nr:serine hydrolase [Bacteroidia bacterium]